MQVEPHGVFIDIFMFLFLLLKLHVRRVLGIGNMEMICFCL